MFNDVFIAIYTHRCKSYCDDKFFNNLLSSDIGEARVVVVDNSNDLTYMNELNSKFGGKIEFNHIDINREEKETQFQRNVTESVSFLRDKFLKTDCKYFVILESDVLPRDPKWLHYFMEVVDQADIIGGLYYLGFQPSELWVGPDRVEPTHHVLSGCTLYKRSVIENFPFRWSRENLGAFPDAWICYDCNRTPGITTRLGNYTKIVCDHLEKAPCNRGHGECN